MKSIFFVLDTSAKKDFIKKKEKKNSIPIVKKKIYFNTYNTYKSLVCSTVIILSIKNKYLSLYEPIRPKSLLGHNFFLILNSLKEKYGNKTLDIIELSKKAPQYPIPFNTKNLEKNSEKNINTEIINIIEEDTDDININYNNNLSISKLSESNFSKNSEIKFLNNKKQREKIDIKNINKKKVFNLEKIFEKNKKSNTPGRKKKNSGEYGVHNKFSNDNIMRKLKNKVIESARKLISQKIKDESNLKFKYFELHKIGGAFSQELNIKFNFWFHLQKFKDIFQFKCSSKYSKEICDNNNILIKKIYSNENIKNFPLTVKLLEMSFCQYYHEIFLAENPNWIYIYQIPFNQNYYEISYFFNTIRSSVDYNSDDDELYIKKINQLAEDYEKFFLIKNPRKFMQKKICEINEKNEEIKKIIERLDKLDENNYNLKYQFLSNAVKYRPDLIDFVHDLNKKRD